MTEDGKKRALKSGVELERLKKALDKALEEWTSATELAEANSNSR